jgi:DtxR family transcriptional regulator, Mn-dependent transcriptional regulator
MPSVTVENYIKRIYLEQQRSAARLVAMGRLAEVMQVTPGTATSMIKALADSGLVAYVRRSGVRLSRGGERLALHVLRRHRLLEQFLVQVVGLDWSEVHSEAEELEHVVSDKLMARIDELLAHPSFDPHGDPIPSAGGKRPPERLQDLAHAPGGRTLRVARVLDQDPAFLRFATKHGLRPGGEVELLENDPVSDAVLMRCNGGRPFTLGSGAAAKVLVRS